MDHTDVGRMWDENANDWTRLSRAGYDRCRDLINTPAFLEMLPAVAGLSGLDIGCGEGNNTRLVAQRGARMSAIDISQTFIRHASEHEKTEPLGIRYQQASAVQLPFPDGTFDFVMATMSFMDVPDHERVLREASRVIRPGGFLQFSITHPCFQTPRTKWVLDENGRRVAMECGDYFRECNGDIEEWTFGAAPPEISAGVRKFRIPRFTRTLSSWVNLVLDARFSIERLCEPYPSDGALRADPGLYDLRIIAYFLIIRCRKPRS